MASRSAWRTHPESQVFVDEMLNFALARASGAAAFSARLLQTTGIRLLDILDHVGFNDSALAARAQSLGWQYADGVLRHADGLFPDLLTTNEKGLKIAFRVASIERFATVHSTAGAIEGTPYGPFRRARAFHGEGVSFWAVERSGHVAYEMPAVPAALVRSARLHLQTFRSRRRHFDSVPVGLKHTENLIEAAVADLGQHWACDLFLRAEREYWMQRCDAGRLQYHRQLAAGVGWCNIDHHTYDSSREHFAHTVRIFEKLGYVCRELFYAGAQAGWGSQVLEQPVLRSTIFADIDLSPEELDIDFAHLPLQPLPKFRRAGLWCAMHGESILQGGLNHVAGLYEQITLRTQLNLCGVRMMPPFSERAELYQELTEGQWSPVDPALIDRLQDCGHLTEAEAEDFRLRGAIATHLENIERNHGYKGFNQPGIDGVLRVIDPRKNLREENA